MWYYLVRSHIMKLLNGLIKHDWLNLAYDTFKLKCKNLILLLSDMNQNDKMIISRKWIKLFLYFTNPKLVKLQDHLWRYKTTKKKKSLIENQNTPTPTIQSLKQPRRLRVIMKIVIIYHILFQLMNISHKKCHIKLNISAKKFCISERKFLEDKILVVRH